MANSPGEPKPLVFTDVAPAAPAPTSGPKPLSFGSELASQVVPPAATVQALSTRTPGALTFSEDTPDLREVDPVRPLFEQDEHPAMRTAVATARRLFPDMYRKESFRMDGHFRQLLPIRVPTVLAWADKLLAQGPDLARRAADIIQQFSKLDVAPLLAEALESTKPPTGLIQKLLQRQREPSEFVPLLREADTALGRIREAAEKCCRETQDFGEVLTIQLCSLAVIADVAGQAPDAALGDALRRRQLTLQQAVQQSGLSMLQLADVRRLAVDLSAQISAFITVTLPAIAMAKAQHGD